MIALCMNSHGQINSVSLQASGLTCSMCSKAVKTALEGVSFVRKVDVDIKNQQYTLSFKDGNAVDFDVLKKAVQDAGFSVASMKATATVHQLLVQKDGHFKIGGQAFHFLNASGQTLDGNVGLSVVDKGYVSSTAFKKYAALTKMDCVQTGRMASCCASGEPAGSRIYHVVI